MHPDPSNTSAAGVDPEQWLESVQSSPTEQAAPPSFNSLNTVSEDAAAKEVVNREENMKFPQSLKEELVGPGRKAVDIDAQKLLYVHFRSFRGSFSEDSLEYSLYRR